MQSRDAAGLHEIVEHERRTGGGDRRGIAEAGGDTDALDAGRGAIADRRADGGSELIRS